ncbi:serine/threonine-protein kinase [Actinomadura rugatobispora]|uniref:Serine/threonine-protein kinase n=1 Tax=Actinomadura rugatobispora TaxID=1994 RepID=A0ABW0ZXZ4_9ACTN|nr:serine/threonine-protein kinase [Actinomadura rugatobispora]
MKGVATSGDRIGHYRVLKTLGEGGMGVVYLGADPEGRNVAIKVLRPAVAGDATARRRLAREVDSMRRVHSPNVAEILDADVTADRPYIVTQYVPGRTLEELVEEDGPIYGHALQRLAVGLASALSAIHGAGIIHRDLKPGNVMLVDTEPVVIDFGIAQGADATRLTATGMVIGTPGYLAPEIIEGEDAGAPSDVHAWAGTVAYAATGRPPFGSGTFESIFYKIMSGTPDLDGVPEALMPVLRSAMARNPAERPTAVSLGQLTRRIHFETTITDTTRVDEHFTLPDQGSPGASQPVERPPTDHAQTFSMPPSASQPSVSQPSQDGRASRPVETPPPTPPPIPAAAPVPPPTPPAPSQPKDFKGMLPPAAPPPVPPPGPSPYETGQRYDQSWYDQASYAPYQPQQQPPQPPQPSRGALQRGDQGAPPPGPAPYDPYGPGTQPRPDQRPDQRSDRRPDQQQRDARRPGDREAAKPYGWYRVLSFLVLVALLGFANIAPVLSLAVTVVGVLVLRMGDKAAKGMENKRTRRGPRSGDAMAAAFKTPLHLPGAVLMTLLLAGLAALAGFILLVVLMFANPDMTASRAIAYSCMAVIVLLCLAPGSGAPRRQMARLWGALLPRTEAALAGALIVGVFAVVLVALSQQQPPDTTPIGGMSQSLEDLRVSIRELVSGLPLI